MKQNLLFNQLTAMPKRLAIVLTVLFTLGVGSMLGAEVTFTKDGFSSSDKTETKDPVTLTFDEVTINNQQIRFSSGKKMVVTSSAGKITRIDVSTNSTNAYISPLGNTLSSGTWTKESDTKYYWTGEAASITFTPNSAIRITEIKVSYSDASSGGGSGDIGDCNVTYDFTKINFTGWSNSYTQHVVEYEDATVTFKAASKQTSTITDQPVTKGNEVSLVMTDGSTLSSVTWVCKQWTTKAQTITLHYSTNGGTSYTTTGVTSTNFKISKDNLPAGTNAVKITFNSTSNQSGITSCSIEKVCNAGTTYTLTNRVSPVGYGTVSPSSVAGIPEGTPTTSSSNTYIVNGTKVTATPTTATAQYTYAFSKWQDLPATVNGDATVTAVFTRTTNKYTITWKNGSTVLETDENVPYGDTPSYDGTEPTKAATAQYTYAFTGWNPAIASVTKDQTYTAQFSQTVNKYTITWKNADGTTLKTEEVAYGTTPSYTGTTPTKAATEQYTYTHDGWTPSVVAVTGNAEYTATFAETPRTYTITLNTNGGTINAGNVTSYKYGTGATLPTNVTKEHHQFGGWFDNSGCTGTAVTTISTAATGNKEYWAKWTELPKYTVTWSVDGNTTTEEVYSGDKATKAPTIDENNLPCDGADKFVGWTTDEYQGDSAPGTLYPTANEIPAITEPTTFYAVFADYAD